MDKHTRRKKSHDATRIVAQEEREGTPLVRNGTGGMKTGEKGGMEGRIDDVCDEGGELGGRWRDIPQNIK